MATQVPAVTETKVAGGMFATKEEFATFIVENVDPLIGPKLEKLLEPFTAKQQTVLGDALEMLKRADKREKKDSEKGLMLARHCRAINLGQGDVDKAIAAVKRTWGSDDPVLESLEFGKKMRDGGPGVEKNLSAGNAAAAGNMILPDYAIEWIELLRNQTVVRGLPGVRVLPMPVGGMAIRKQITAGTAAYVGEAANIASSDQAVAPLNLLYRKLVALTVVSNDLLRMSGNLADAFVRDDLLAVSAIREDLAFLRGSGSSYEPTGIRNWAAAGNVFASAGTTLAQSQSDLAKAIRFVQQGNVPLTPENGYWIMAPRTYWGLYNLTTTVGAYVFAEELRQGRLMGYQIRVTNQVPINLSGTGSELYFVHAPSCVIGDALTVTAEFFANGAYYNGSVVVSGISTDESVIRVLREHDFALRHDVGASVITGVAIA